MGEPCWWMVGESRESRFTLGSNISKLQGKLCSVYPRSWTTDGIRAKNGFADTRHSQGIEYLDRRLRIYLYARMGLHIIRGYPQYPSATSADFEKPSV
jgi:hypothetical protein